jgi:rhodanese-related sulfurtransferase
MQVMKTTTIFMSLGLLAALLSHQPTAAAEVHVPPGKQTSLGLYITAENAHRAMRKDASLKLVDVRTPEEFSQIGHAVGSWHVPLSQSASEFVGRFQQVASPDERVLVICRSGNRSAVAVDMLARAGYKNAYTVIDGFEGDRVSDSSSPDFGRRVVNGWKNAGLKWTTQVDAKKVVVPAN